MSSVVIFAFGFAFGCLAMRFFSSPGIRTRTLRADSGHEHDFEPIEWDDATMGPPFFCFEGSDNPVEEYAKKCTKCGEIRKDWVGPPGDRIPEAPIYRGRWTKELFKQWVQEKVKENLAESRRRQ